MSELEGRENYDRWNSAIADEFFSGRYGGRPVYLDLEDDALERIKAAAGGQGDPSEGLVAAVKPSIRLHGRGALFGVHAARLRGWRAGDMGTPPPVIALLALLSLVAERMHADHEFRATNYYGRFITLCGGDSTDPNLRAKVIRGFALHSGELWTALNRWLEADPDTRGLPTAFSFDHRVYVGRPISQALVRDGDRRALRLLFSEIGLRPGQVVAVDDMVRILRSWLPESPASQTLRRLARDDDVLAHIAEVACVELQSWSGEVSSGQRLAGSRVALTATIRRLPRRGLNLTATLVAGTEVDDLEPGPGCDEAGRAALASADGRPRLLDPDPSGWRPIADLGIPDLLISRFEAMAGDATVRRQARPVVVLARDELSSVFREVERVRLGAEHLLLAVDAVRPRLERELELVARAGWRLNTELPGLPAGWILYEGVEIVAISETQAPDLSVLIPVAWTELTLEGGLKLPGRATWHALAPPELRASAPPGRRLSAVLFEEVEHLEGNGEDPDAGTLAGDTLGEGDHAATNNLADGERLIDVLDTFEGATVVALDDLELSPGDYRVRLVDTHNELPLSATSMRLRSADASLGRPALRLPPRGPEHGHLWPLTAALDADEGAAIDDDEPAEAEAEEEPQPEATVPVPQCYVTGAHHFLLEAAGRERPAYGATTGGACRHCGLEKRFPARPKSWRASGERHVQAIRAAKRPSVPPRREGELVDGELLLDALSAIGCGSARELLRLFERSDSPSLRAATGLKELSALGHVDVALDQELRPLRWAVAPTTLVIAGDECFLAGERSEGMLHAVGRIAQTSWYDQGAAPARISVDVASGEAEDIAESLGESLGRDVQVSHNPAQSLARHLPSLWDLRARLPILRSRPLDQALERLVGTRWAPADTAVEDGTYRTRRLPRTVWHQMGGDVRRADARLGKWLATAPGELMVVDPTRHTVTCPLGAEPPWLFERALVLASGRAPAVSVEGQVVEYADVAPDLAHELRSAMTGVRPASSHV